MHPFVELDFAHGGPDENLVTLYECPGIGWKAVENTMEVVIKENNMFYCFVPFEDILEHFSSYREKRKTFKAMHFNYYHKYFPA